MILYFTGTGNSRHAAMRIAEGTADKTVDLFEIIKNHDYSDIEFYSDKPWIIVTPTYAWRIPPYCRRTAQKS